MFVACNIYIRHHHSLIAKTDKMQLNTKLRLMGA